MTRTLREVINFDWWRPTWRQVLSSISIAIALVVLLVGVFPLVSYWSTTIEYPTLLQGLITASIPVLVAVFANLYTQRRTEDKAVRVYLDQTSSMLIPDKDRPSLNSASPGDNLSSVARALTRTVLSNVTRRSARRLLRGQRVSFALHPGEAFDRGEAHAEQAGGLALGGASSHGVDYLPSLEVKIPLQVE